MAKAAKVLSDRFELVGQVGLDERKRVSLAKAFELLKQRLGEDEAGLRFAVYLNEAGQLLLSPEIAVPVHELWLYRNPEARRRVGKGLEQASEGQLKDLGSFAKYADDEIE
ncbi:MAG TPA: hypothetical protein VEC38_13450 [Candidatus Binataceae bacterium]|nr:hypothetical protein [Candidatus Binataceae bacterium]